MNEGVVNEGLRLELSLTDGVATRFPRARIYNELDAVIATVDLVHVENGLYRGTWTPTTVGRRSIHYVVYSDAGRTVVDATYERVTEAVVVRAFDQDDVFQRTLGHLGENVRDDVLSYNVDGRPLSFRRRIFPTKALALASTPGGTGEGEIFTIIGSASHFDAAKWETLVRTLEP